MCKLNGSLNELKNKKAIFFSPASAVAEEIIPERRKKVEQVIIYTI